MSRKIPNIVGAKPQVVAMPVGMGIISTNHLNEKEKIFLNEIVNAIFAGIDDHKQYQDDTAITQIDLILGRLEDLLLKKIDTFNINTTLIISELAEIIAKELPQLTSDDFELIQISIETSLSEKIIKLKDELRTMFNLSVPDNSTEFNEDDIKNDEIDIDNLDNSNNQNTRKQKVYSDIKDEVRKEIKKYKFSLYSVLLANYKAAKEDLKDKYNKSKLKIIINAIKIAKDKLSSAIKRIKKIFSFLKQKNTDKKVKKSKAHKNLEKFIEKELKKFQKLMVSFFIANLAVSPAMMKKYIKIINTAISIVNDIVDKANEYISKINEEVDKFEQTALNAINTIERNIKRVIRQILARIPQIFITIMAAYYGPPAFIGFILLGVSVAITGICWILTKVEKFLAKLVNFILPIIAKAVPLFAKFLVSFLDIAMFILNLVSKILDTLLPIAMWIIKTLWRIIVVLILRLIMDTLSIFKNYFWPWLKEIFVIAIQDILIPLCENILFPLLEPVLNFVIDTAISLVENILMPMLEVILPVLNMILEIIVPFIKPLVDTIMPILIVFLKIARAVIIPLFRILGGIFIFIIKAIGEVIEKFKEALLALLKIPEWVADCGIWLWDKFCSVFPKWLIEGLGKLCEAIGAITGAVWDGICKIGGWVASLFGGEDDDFEDAKRNYQWLKRRVEESDLAFKLNAAKHAVKNISAESFNSVVTQAKDLLSFLIESNKKINELINKIPNLFKIQILERFEEYVNIKNDFIFVTDITQCKEYLEKTTGKEIKFEKKKTDFDEIYEQTKWQREYNEVFFKKEKAGQLGGWFSGPSEDDIWDEAIANVKNKEKQKENNLQAAVKENEKRSIAKPKPFPFNEDVKKYFLEQIKNVLIEIDIRNGKSNDEIEAYKKIKNDRIQAAAKFNSLVSKFRKK